MTKIKKSSFPKEATAKLMIAVEYYNRGCTDPNDDDATTTFEIFDSLKEAWKFANSNKEIFHSIWVGDFNRERIYKDEDNNWNYEDFSDTFYNNDTISENLGL